MLHIGEVKSFRDRSRSESESDKGAIVSVGRRETSDLPLARMKLP